jgi:hypothetical protein
MRRALVSPLLLLLVLLLVTLLLVTALVMALVILATPPGRTAGRIAPSARWSACTRTTTFWSEIQDV